MRVRARGTRLPRVLLFAAVNVLVVAALRRGDYPSYVRDMVVVDVAAGLVPARHFDVPDDHLNPDGQRVVAERLTAVIRALEARRPRS